jgi:hypothetical protein
MSQLDRWGVECDRFIRVFEETGDLAIGDIELWNERSTGCRAVFFARVACRRPSTEGTSG